MEIVLIRKENAPAYFSSTLIQSLFGAIPRCAEQLAQTTHCSWNTGTNAYQDAPPYRSVEIIEGLSRLLGNWHGRFLGELDPATGPCLPDVYSCAFQPSIINSSPLQFGPGGDFVMPSRRFSAQHNQYWLLQQIGPGGDFFAMFFSTPEQKMSDNQHC